jgi:hypothetical protein
LNGGGVAVPLVPGQFAMVPAALEGAVLQADADAHLLLVMAG